MSNGKGVILTWLGHATYKIQTPGGQIILVDPWVMSNPACPEAEKKVDKLDAMFITHGHMDHIGDAVELGKAHPGAPVVAMHEIGLFLNGKGVENTIGMNKGGTVEVAGVKGTMVDAKHSSAISDGDKLIPGGEAAGFVLEFEGGRTIYCAGDTCIFGDMKLIADLYGPEVAILPIGDHYTMSPREAAYALKNFLKPRWVLPVHYGTFPVLTGTVDRLRQLTADQPGLEIVELKPGESKTF